MRNLLSLVEPGVIIVAILIFSFLLIAIARGRQIPQCFQCGASKVRPSRPAGKLDWVANIFLIRPYRCSGCRTRFHAFRPFARSKQEPAA